MPLEDYEGAEAVEHGGRRVSYEVSPSCYEATAVAARGRYLVGVEAIDYEPTTSERMRAQAITALKAQLDRL